MQKIIWGFQFFSGVSFLFYGLSCLFSKKMVFEFERYGLKKFRILTGFLEVMGGLGQIAGFWIPSLFLIASMGLGCLMVCGIWTRWRIRDPWLDFLPALVLLVINVFLVWTVFDV